MHDIDVSAVLVQANKIALVLDITAAAAAAATIIATGRLCAGRSPPGSALAAWWPAALPCRWSVRRAGSGCWC